MIGVQGCLQGQDEQMRVWQVVEPDHRQRSRWAGTSGDEFGKCKMRITLL